MTDARRLDDIVLALSEHGDVAAMSGVLTGTLAALLPPHLVDVRYRRTATDRLHGRPGTPTEITVHTGDCDLILGAEASIAHRVNGVVLSRRVAPITEWVAELSRALEQRAQQDAAARGALEQLLLDEPPKRAGSDRD